MVTLFWIQWCDLRCHGGLFCTFKPVCCITGAALLCHMNIIVSCVCYWQMESDCLLIYEPWIPMIPEKNVSHEHITWCWIILPRFATSSVMDVDVFRFNFVVQGCYIPRDDIQCIVQNLSIEYVQWVYKTFIDIDIPGESRWKLWSLINVTCYIHFNQCRWRVNWKIRCFYVKGFCYISVFCDVYIKCNIGMQAQNVIHFNYISEMVQDHKHVFEVRCIRPRITAVRDETFLWV